MCINKVCGPLLELPLAYSQPQRLLKGKKSLLYRHMYIMHLLFRFRPPQGLSTNSSLRGRLEYPRFMHLGL
jgi:hypothetical protein